MRMKDLDGDPSELVALTLTCGRFAMENVGRPEPNIEERPDIETLLNECSMEAKVSLFKCFRRKMAMIDVPTHPLALVPDFARAGDLVCIMNGSPTPFVLRKRGQDFEFIGECYVHGIMYGEAVDWSQEEGDRFDIRSTQVARRNQRVQAHKVAKEWLTGKRNLVKGRYFASAVEIGALTVAFDLIRIASLHHSRWCSAKPRGKRSCRTLWSPTLREPAVRHLNLQKPQHSCIREAWSPRAGLPHHQQDLNHHGCHSILLHRGR